MLPETNDSQSGRVLVLALGNDLLGDDGVGLLAARRLSEEFGDAIDIVETGEAGLALVELMEGYDKVLLLDAVMTGGCAPGTVIDFDLGALRKIVAPSPHYAGIPEVLELARRLGIVFPSDLRILGMEVENPFSFNEQLSPAVEGAMDEFVAECRAILGEWLPARRPAADALPC